MSLKRNLEDAATVEPRRTASFSNNPAYTSYLFDLVTKGRLKELQGENLTNFKLRNDVGESLLHCAVETWLMSGVANTKLIRYLISQDPSLVEEKNSYGQTALCYVCSSHGHSVYILIIVIKELLGMSTTAALNVADQAALTPLHYFMSNEEQFMRNSKCRNMISTPSSTKNNLDVFTIAKVFLEKGANINAEDKQGRNVLAYTLNAFTKYSNRNRRIVDFLLNNGAIVNATALKAVNIKDFFKYLLKHIELNAKDENGWTVLHHVLMNDRVFNNGLGREWKVKLLLEHGAQIEEGVNVIDLAREQGCSFDLIAFLMPHFPGYDVNTTDTSGATLLLQYGTSAAQNIEMLLALGADIKAKDYSGNTIIHNIMTEFSDPNLFKKMIDLGAEPLVCNNAGDNIIQFICRRCMQCDMPRYLYDWLPLFKYFLGVPQFSSTPLPQLNTTIITPLLKYFCSQFNGDSKSKVLQLLFFVVRCLHENITLLTIDTPIPAMCNFQFSSSMLDPVAHLIALMDSSNFGHDVEEYIHFMLTFGFNVVNTENSSVSALTILLMLYGGHKLDLVQELIDNGVSVESSALEFIYIPNSNEETTTVRQLTKSSFFMPDALLVAYIKNLGGVVDELELIDHCWFPPIFLVYFLPKLSSPESFKYWFKKFSVYGDIPCGTEMFLMCKPLLEAATEDLTEPLPHDPEMEEMCNTLVSAFSVNTPASLRDLCKYEVRHYFARTANANACSLPCLLKDHVPSTLQFLVKQGP